MALAAAPQKVMTEVPFWRWFPQTRKAIEIQFVEPGRRKNILLINSNASFVYTKLRDRASFATDARNSSNAGHVREKCGARASLGLPF
ncbi:hypothetical protein Rvan_2492 [Rhodomicrobium vannielii ATCC 17100]|uniref:Uncharacterized protein n=1 Tax=Rhodomicrobium vannielii (strain ATCC 17100 / DSM 162 / LMG 4299 / NCIMB 10020 / ATH 3.1.1) TaxID=648757 RepID=E3I642_RHOVT|nr:hypothetical protein [Rhodomicrobium vannielii]ADP71707.1 hypothetical protein Rvan_2492 [Rhodomicrobium vannielii ATCC 17100]